MVCSTYLEEIRTRLEDLIARARLIRRTLTTDQLNWQPGPELWSIGEIFEHMRLADEPYLAILENGSQSPKYGPGKQVKHSFMGKLIIAGAGPNGNAPAPKKMIPAPGPYALDVIDRFIDQHERMIELARQSEGVDLSAVKLRNPIVPLIVFNLADAFEIVTCHAERHIGQIEQTPRRPGYPA